MIKGASVIRWLKLLCVFNESKNRFSFFVILIMSKNFECSIYSRVFEVFLTVVSEKNYTKAAKFLGITQSAVSQNIANLERQLGFELFEGGTRPLRLTPEAHVLFNELQHQRTAIEQTLSSLQARNSYKPMIRIGIVESLINTIAPYFFREIQKNFSKVHLQSGTTDDLLEKLGSGDLDVIAASDHVHHTHSNFCKLFLFAEPHILILPKSMGSLRNRWNWQDLKLSGLPFAHYTANTSSGKQTDEFFIENIGIVPSCIEVDSNRLVFSLVESGMAWGITQPLSVLAEGCDLFDRLAVFPTPTITSNRRLCLFSRSEYPREWLDDVQKIILNGLQEHAMRELSEVIANLGLPKDSLVVNNRPTD